MASRESNHLRQRNIKREISHLQRIKSKAFSIQILQMSNQTQRIQALNYHHWWALVVLCHYHRVQMSQQLLTGITLYINCEVSWEVGSNLTVNIAAAGILFSQSCYVSLMVMNLVNIGTVLLLYFVKCLKIEDFQQWPSIVYAIWYTRTRVGTITTTV